MFSFCCFSSRNFRSSVAPQNTGYAFDVQMVKVTHQQYSATLPPAFKTPDILFGSVDTPQQALNILTLSAKKYGRLDVATIKHALDGQRPHALQVILWSVTPELQGQLVEYLKSQNHQTQLSNSAQYPNDDRAFWRNLEPDYSVW